MRECFVFSSSLRIKATNSDFEVSNLSIPPYRALSLSLFLQFRLVFMILSFESLEIAGDNSAFS